MEDLLRAFGVMRTVRLLMFPRLGAVFGTPAMCVSRSSVLPARPEESFHSARRRPRYKYFTERTGQTCALYPILLRPPSSTPPHAARPETTADTRLVVSVRLAAGVVPYSATLPVTTSTDAPQFPDMQFIYTQVESASSVPLGLAGSTTRTGTSVVEWWTASSTWGPYRLQPPSTMRDVHARALLTRPLHHPLRRRGLSASCASAGSAASTLTSVSGKLDVAQKTNARMDFRAARAQYEQATWHVNGSPVLHLEQRGSHAMEVSWVAKRAVVWRRRRRERLAGAGVDGICAGDDA
ncbi:hypothetical protein FB451DRAFT_1390270 [Mycena latifolia]|nr:hypothetical protein FB451DRAFT_1390270 [Mycena latifolia]